MLGVRVSCEAGMSGWGEERREESEQSWSWDGGGVAAAAGGVRVGVALGPGLDSC